MKSDIKEDKKLDFLYNKNESKEEKLKKIHDYLDTYFTEESYRIKSNLKALYISGGILLFICLFAIIAGSLLLPMGILKFVVVFFPIPLSVLIILVMGIRLFVFGDLDTLRGEIIKKLSYNFIIANFFLTQRRVIKRVVPILPSGIEFECGNGIYTIDASCIWLDESNFPNAFYVPNLPNPLKFDFNKYLIQAFDNYRKNDMENYKDGIDILYSAENLKIVKKDDYVAKMHKDRTEVEQRLVLIIFGMAILWALSLLAEAYILKQPVSVTIAQNVSSIPANVGQIR